MNAITSVCKGITAGIISRVLSDHAKRMIMLTALYGAWTDQKEVSKDTLAKLNQAMHLTSEGAPTEVLSVPVWMQTVIWDGEQIENIRSEITTHEKRIDSILALVPQCLRYSNDREDISRLLNAMPHVVA